MGGNLLLITHGYGSSWTRTRGLIRHVHFDKLPIKGVPEGNITLSK